MFFQGVDGAKLDGQHVGGFKDDLGRHSCVVGLLPSRGTQAPLVAGFQTGELVLRHRRGKVIAGGFRECQKIVRHDGTNRVSSVVTHASIAKTIPIEPRHRVSTAALQFGA